MDVFIPSISISISTLRLRYYTKHKHNLLFLSFSSTFFLFFFFFFFFNSLGDAVDQPFRFQSPHLLSINQTRSYDLLNSYDSSESSMVTVWPIHKNPAVANLSDLSDYSFGHQTWTSYAILCYVNTSKDAFFLSVILTDKYTVSNYGISGGEDDLLARVSSFGHIIWMANRNKPVMGGIPKLQLEEEEQKEATLNNKNKSLVLRGGDGDEVWRVNAGNAPTIELRGDGNLVIIDNNTKSVVWQSFDHATDTLVMGQTLSLGQRLVSRSSPSNFSEGSFFMEKVHHGISLFYKASSFLLPYYSFQVEDCHDANFSLTWSGFDNSSSLFVSCDSDNLGRGQVKTPSAPILRLESNGELNIKGVETNSVTNRCDVPNNCGAYLTCTKESCSSHCETSDFKENCKPSDNGPALSDSCSNHSLVSKMGKLDNISYFPNAYDEQIHINVSNSEECKTMCYGNCTCAASFYTPRYNTCTLVENVLQLTAIDEYYYEQFMGSMGFIKMFKPISPALSGR